LGLLGDVLIALTLATVGLGACYLPSARAARTNPADVLRSE
jgi:ABC-type lipoprotein release transport system permease subunit